LSVFLRFVFLLFFCIWVVANYAIASAGVTPTPVPFSFISGDQFNSQVDQANVPVVLDFCATWCVPCQAYSPVVTEAVNAYQGKIVFYKVDVSDDANQQRLHRYSIESMPTLLVIEKSQVVERWEGILKLKDLKAKLNDVLKKWVKTTKLNP
jgi:thioredoxin 1